MGGFLLVVFLQSHSKKGALKTPLTWPVDFAQLRVASRLRMRYVNGKLELDQVTWLECLGRLARFLVDSRKRAAEGRHEESASACFMSWGTCQDWPAFFPSAQRCVPTGFKQV